MEESVLRGNAAILKCHISTFVTEYVSVSSWIISEGEIDELEIKAEENDLGILLMRSCPFSIWYDLVRFPCPWCQSVFRIYSYDFQRHFIFTVVSQAYTVNLMEENVLRGNSAILKCHIPSFVTEYVTVASWIISEGDVDELEFKVDDSANLGIS